MTIESDTKLVSIANDLQNNDEVIRTLNSHLPNSNASPAVFHVLFPFADLPKPLFEFCFNLVKSNLYTLYVDAQDTGWSDRTKKREMSDKNGRYIIAFKRASNQSDGNSEAPVISSVIASADYVPHVSDIPLGYLYYVCCMEDSYDDQDGGMDGDGKAPVIYCMELQLIPEARNTGLGSIFMNFHEQIGLFFGLRKSMLTVFKKNEGAMRFYKRLGYSPDNISPSMCMTEKRASRFSYEIMKKDLKRL